MVPYSQKIEELLSSLNTNEKSGLTSAEVLERQKEIWSQ